MYLYLKTITLACFLAFSGIAKCQTETRLNTIDQKGLKQGHWIKKYPNESIMYDGFFKDDHPVGEFKRFYEDKKPMSVLVYSNDGKQAEATLYHSNGYPASKGKYVNKLKEGKWQFFSKIFEGYLICEEFYKNNLRHGLSVKFYPDSTIAEKVNFINDIKQGEWIQYYPNGKKCLRSVYLDGKLNGKIEVWYETGALEFSGQYKNEIRDGSWSFFNNDGTLKYNIKYNLGITEDKQLEIEESGLVDFLEQNKGKIPDPEKTGNIKQ